MAILEKGKWVYVIPKGMSTISVPKKAGGTEFVPPLKKGIYQVDHVYSGGDGFMRYALKGQKRPAMYRDIEKIADTKEELEAIYGC